MLRYLGIIAMKIPLLNRLGFVQGMGRGVGAQGFGMMRAGGAPVLPRLGAGVAGGVAGGAAGQFGGPVAARAGLRAGTAGVAGMAARTAVATAPAMIPPGTVFGPAIPRGATAVQVLANQAAATRAAAAAPATFGPAVAARGGMMGRMGSRMGRGLTGRMPKIGLGAGLAITGANVAYQMQQGDTGGAIGAGVGGMAGMVIGGAAGSFAGPAGTMVGAMLGSALGTMIGESVGSNMTAHPSQIDLSSSRSGPGGGFIHPSNQSGVMNTKLSNQVRG